jgi:hypothetical protein
MEKVETLSKLALVGRFMGKLVSGVTLQAWLEEGWILEAFVGLLSMFSFVG